MRLLLIPLVALAGCPGADKEPGAADTDPGGDTALDSADTASFGPEALLDAAELRVLAAGSSAAGLALGFGPADADGKQGAWISAYFASQACRYDGVSGTVGPEAAAVCFTAESKTEYLGYSLATNGALVAIGAIGGSDPGPYAGKAYVFAEGLTGERSSADAVAELLAEAQGDYAGSAIAWVGDTEGDGIQRLIVGAPSNDDNGAGAGRAYILGDHQLVGTVALADAATRVSGSTSSSAVKHGAPEAGDGVGSVLNGAGDLDGDGLTEVLLGCNGADDGGVDAGLLAVFRGPLPSGEVALRDADVIWTGEASSQYVGDFADGVGDVDGDGLGDVAVTGEMVESGRTWVLSGPGATGPVSQAGTSFAGEAVGDQAGASVAGAGDVDGDGRADLVIGAYGSDAVAVDAGAAYLFLSPFPTGAVTVAEAQARFTGEVEGDGAGRSVEGAGDYDGDGKMDLLIGAPYNDGGGPFAGAGYVVLGR